MRATVIALALLAIPAAAFAGYDPGDLVDVNRAMRQEIESSKKGLDRADQRLKDPSYGGKDHCDLARLLPKSIGVIEHALKYASKKPKEAQAEAKKIIKEMSELRTEIVGRIQPTMERKVREAKDQGKLPRMRTLLEDFAQAAGPTDRRAVDLAKGAGCTIDPRSTTVDCS